MKKILTYSILGICAGILLFTSCKKDDVSPSNSNGSSSSSNSSSNDSDTDPLLGSFTLGGNTYPFYKSKNSVVAFNGQLTAGGTYTTISGANTLSGTFAIVAKSSSSTLTAGDYDIINADSTVKAGTAVLIGSLITNNTNFVSMYGVSGKINISLANGKTTVTFVNITANSKTDGSGDNLGTLTGSIAE